MHFQWVLRVCVCVCVRMHILCQDSFRFCVTSFCPNLYFTHIASSLLWSATERKREIYCAQNSDWIFRSHNHGHVFSSNIFRSCWGCRCCSQFQFTPLKRFGCIKSVMHCALICAIFIYMRLSSIAESCGISGSILHLWHTYAYKFPCKIIVILNCLYNMNALPISMRFEWIRERVAPRVQREFRDTSAYESSYPTPFTHMHVRRSRWIFFERAFGPRQID